MERVSAFVSIIVPVLDDTEALARLLPAIAPNDEIEVIVVNGGPPDAGLTMLTENRPGVVVRSSAAGRGRQMNVGALAAGGRWLLFLHADTRLPAEWLAEIRRADVDPQSAGGSFRLQLDSSAWQARVIDRCVQWRVKWLDLAYGDQALFVRREVFHAIDGYREWRIMEDVDFIRRVRKAGTLYHSPLPVVTSARRWQREGWWRRSAKNVLLQLSFAAGVSPERLATRYRSAPATPDAIVVMARAPSDSRGKTRIARGLPGDQPGLRRALLLDTLEAVGGVRGADVFVAFEPAEALEELASLVTDSVRLFAQRGDTLGDRMRNAFADVLDRGYSNVVTIGSDLPTLPVKYLEQALTALRRRACDVVIGPAADGGYYLLALSVLRPSLFAEVPWGTPAVLAKTLEAALESRLSVRWTPEWYDVDEPGDLRRVLAARAAPRTRAWIAARHAALMSAVVMRGTQAER